MLKQKPAKKGDIITLQRQDVKVEKCKECGKLMVNLDADELKPGDLLILKRKGVLISNPETEELFCVNCEYKEKESFGSAIASFLSSTLDDDDDDSTFFSGGSFGGGSSFGGFGGGGFGGAGCSGGF